MAIKYISGINKEKQQLRRSTHVGSDLSNGNVLNPAQAFDPQAVFVYLNGVMLKEGTSGNGGDYVTTGNSTITFNSTVSATDVIEVVSYTFSNPTLPETMVENTHTVSQTEATDHGATFISAETDAFVASTNTVNTATAHGLSIGDVITVTAADESDITLTRYRVKTVPTTDSFTIENMDYSTPSFSDNETSSLSFTQVFSLVVNGLSLVNKTMVFLNGLLLVENSDYYRDRQAITLDVDVNIFENSIVDVKSFGAFVFPTTSEIQNSGIEVADDGIVTLFTSADFTSNTTSVFNMHVSARHATATNDAYRSGLFLVRVEKNNPPACYIHRGYDAGNIGTEIGIAEQRTISSYSLTATAPNSNEYLISGTDRTTTYTDASNQTITIGVGETLVITNNDFSAHPLYIKTAQGTGTGDQVEGVTGQGTGTVTWTPTGTGTYYYQCANHDAMNGTITVVSGQYEYSDITDGKLGIIVDADTNYWYVKLVNRAGHDIVAGYKAFAVTN